MEDFLPFKHLVRLRRMSYGRLYTLTQDVSGLFGGFDSVLVNLSNR